MLSGLNESKGSNEEEEEKYRQACVLLSAALIAVVISFSFSFSLFSSIYHFPLLCGNLAFYSNRLPHQKLAGNIRGG
jgi:hypothetical protein